MFADLPKMKTPQAQPAILPGVLLFSGLPRLPVDFVALLVANGHATNTVQISAL
jgi:hypothetical protein